MIKQKTNNSVVYNFSKVNLMFLLPPLILLMVCYIYFYLNSSGGDFVDEYVSIQKNTFLYLNGILSKYSLIQENLTQLGDVTVFFALISFLLVLVPKIWEVLLTSSIFSLIASVLLKSFFKVPRPAAIYENENFTIIGKVLKGANSLPSGHSISTFVVISTLMFAFMPRKPFYKVLWVAFMIFIGIVIASSRVAVGAHYPMDVLVGCSVGYIVTVIGVIVTNKVKWLCWLGNNKIYPYIAILSVLWMAFMIYKTTLNNLFIFSLALCVLGYTLFIIIKFYVQIEKH